MTPGVHNKQNELRHGKQRQGQTCEKPAKEERTTTPLLIARIWMLTRA